MAKTTIEIDDELLRQAKRIGRETGRSLEAVIEEALRALLVSKQKRSRYRLPDLSVGSETSLDQLEKSSWPELRDIIYGDEELR